MIPYFCIRLVHFYLNIPEDVLFNSKHVEKCVKWDNTMYVLNCKCIKLELYDIYMYQKKLNIHKNKKLSIHNSKKLT
jgi:hypothetical protein